MGLEPVTAGSLSKCLTIQLSSHLIKSQSQVRCVLMLLLFNLNRLSESFSTKHDFTGAKPLELEQYRVTSVSSLQRASVLALKAAVLVSHRIDANNPNVFLIMAIKLFLCLKYSEFILLQECD